MADIDKNVFQIMLFVSEFVENNMRKVDNAMFHHFLHFPEYFEEIVFFGSLKLV